MTRHIADRMQPRGLRRQKGAVAIMVAFVMMLLLLFGALALDSFHMVVVRNELQNDADAAALAGAGALWTGTPLPNFSLAQDRGDSAIGLNRSLQATLVSGTVESGYWSAASGFQTLPMTPTAADTPAVRARVSREEGVNGGPVQLFLGGVVGVDSMPVAATAVAMTGPPGMIYPGGLFPMVMTKCLFDSYWNTATGKPVNDPVTGLPYIFRIGSVYHYGPCSSGQWTSFLLDDNNVPVIRELVDAGNPEAIEIGDTTWLEPGTKNTLFDYINNCSAAGNKKCEYETVPVITTNVVDVHARVPVGAFACVHILRAVGGSLRYVEVQMSNGCKADGGAGGTYYGTALPPKLSQ